MLEVLGEDYVRTARAKGLGERAVIVSHALRNGMLPVVTQVGLGLAVLIGGALVTETVFAIPGVASLMINAVKLRDVPVVMGIMVVISVFVAVVNLVVDVLYAFVDPRVRLAYDT
jgi:peptide/nickel transport system permease protein